MRIASALAIIGATLILAGCNTSTPTQTQLTDAQLSKLAPGRAVSLGNGTAVYRKASPAPAAAEAAPTKACKGTMKKVDYRTPGGRVTGMICVPAQ